MGTADKVEPVDTIHEMNVSDVQISHIGFDIKRKYVSCNNRIWAVSGYVIIITSVRHQCSR